jgi:hypothetical protein
MLQETIIFPLSSDVPQAEADAEAGLANEE